MLFITKRCWSPGYNVSVLSTCGVCHPEGFIVASFYNLNHTASNHGNNNNSNDNNSNEPSSCVKMLIVDGTGAEWVSNWEENMIITKS